MAFSAERPMRVAIVGSGPSGVFSAEALIKQTDIPVQVDVFDRLPTPYGLVRFGVAPDHLTIKSVTKGFERTFNDERVRFLGNVEFGKDINHADLKAHYDAVIYTVGASSDRRLGIPGEDLKGSMSATEFVAWYNGHPDAAERDIQLAASGVAVIGVGNVALDVSRILLKTTDELQSSDIAEHALTELKNSQVKDVHILGRRGPLQAKFTTKELREFGDLTHAEPVVKTEEMQVTAEEEEKAENVVKKNMDVLRDFMGRESVGKDRRVHLRFLVSPVEILDDGEGNVAGLKIERNELNEEGRPVGTGEFEVLPVQMVLRSVGYKGVALPDVPFDESWGVIPNEGGRVKECVGEYTAGWIKRGPSGVIGTNRKCATDTVKLLLEDAQAGQLAAPTSPTREAIDQLLAQRNVNVFGFDAWKKLDTFELEAGQAAGRPRIKTVQHEQMLKHGQS